MPAAVFSTANEEAVIEDGVVTFTVRGQATGRDDALIEAAIEDGDVIHVFARQNVSQAFVYHGVADDARIVAARTGPGGVHVPMQDRALFRLESRSQAMQIPPVPGDRGPGRDKRAALAHVNAPRDASHLKTFFAW